MQTFFRLLFSVILVASLKLIATEKVSTLLIIIISFSSSFSFVVKNSIIVKWFSFGSLSKDIFINESLIYNSIFDAASLLYNSPCLYNPPQPYHILCFYNYISYLRIKVLAWFGINFPRSYSLTKASWQMDSIHKMVPNLQLSNFSTKFTSPLKMFTPRNTGNTFHINTHKACIVKRKSLQSNILQQPWIR